MSGRVKGFLLFFAAFLLQYCLTPFMPGDVPAPALVLYLTAILVYLYQDSLIWMIYGAVFTFAADLMTGLWPGAGLVAITVVSVLTLLYRYIFNVENMMNAILFAVLVNWAYASVLWGITTLLGGTYSYVYVMRQLPMQILFGVIIMTVIWRIMIRKVVPHRHDRYFE